MYCAIARLNKQGKAADSWSWPKELRPCSVSPMDVFQFDRDSVTRHSGGKELFQQKGLGGDPVRMVWLFGRPGLDESDLTAGVH